MASSSLYPSHNVLKYIITKEIIGSTLGNFVPLSSFAFLIFRRASVFLLFFLLCNVVSLLHAIRSQRKANIPSCGFPSFSRLGNRY